MTFTARCGWGRFPYHPSECVPSPCRSQGSILARWATPEAHAERAHPSGWARSVTLRTMSTLGVAGSMIAGAKRGLVAARAQRKQRIREAGARTGRQVFATARRFLFTLGAFAAFTIAAWSVDYRLGLLVAGASLLVLELFFGE